MIVGSSCLRGSPQHSSLRGGRTTFRVLLERDVLIEPVLKELAGLSLRAIAAELDRRGIKSWRGNVLGGNLGQHPVYLWALATLSASSSTAATTNV